MQSEKQNTGVWKVLYYGEKQNTVIQSFKVMVLTKMKMNHWLSARSGVDIRRIRQGIYSVCVCVCVSMHVVCVFVCLCVRRCFSVSQLLLKQSPINPQFLFFSLVLKHAPLITTVSYDVTQESHQRSRFGPSKTILDHCKLRALGSPLCGCWVSETCSWGSVSTWVVAPVGQRDS